VWYVTPTEEEIFKVFRPVSARTSACHVHVLVLYINVLSLDPNSLCRDTIPSSRSVHWRHGTSENRSLTNS
jgi:hypothetical protein